ncbi:MAG: hypothetical protein KGY81_06165, partial [Phycisphaerae bacterium]|nr:hypothetical protein [Phycisphaerae bacterium]
MRTIHILILFVLLSAGAAAAATPASAPVQREVRSFLLSEFNELTMDADNYRQRVRDECGSLPEGDLLPYVLPAMAYANLTIHDPQGRQDLALRRMPPLIDRAIIQTVRRVRPPHGDLVNLRTYRFHATHLGQLNMAIGAYRLIGGDGRYDDIQDAISASLHAALVASQGRPLRSYPQQSWTFDTVPVIVSLHLHDLRTGQDRNQAVIRRHVAWMQRDGTDPQLGLPYSRLDPRGRTPVPPRGCDLSWRIALLAHVAPNYARQLYANYARHYWKDRLMVAGFAEWPPDLRDLSADADSGPIIMGVGATASTLGLAATAAVDDDERRGRLLGMLPLGETLVRTLLRQNPARRDDLTMRGLIDFDSGYYTGMLYGDAALFYAITWADWSRRPSMPPNALAAEPAQAFVGPPPPGDLAERQARLNEPPPPSLSVAPEPLRDSAGRRDRRPRPASRQAVLTAAVSPASLQPVEPASPSHPIA